MPVGATRKRDLRTGRSLWLDSVGLGVPTRKLREPIDVDVAVVGAGVSGAFMAHELSRDFSVAVFDRRTPLMGSTVASTSLLQWELDTPLTALGAQIGDADAKRVYLRSRAAVEDLIAIVRRERIACGLKAKQSLYLAGDAYGARALRAEAEARAAIGLESVFLHGPTCGPGSGSSAPAPSCPTARPAPIRRGWPLASCVGRPGAARASSHRSRSRRPCAATAMSACAARPMAAWPSGLSDSRAAAGPMFDG